MNNFLHRRSRFGYSFRGMNRMGISWWHACAVMVLALLANPHVAIGTEAKSADGEWTKAVSAAKKEGKLGLFLYQRGNIEAAPVAKLLKEIINQ